MKQRRGDWLTVKQLSGVLGITTQGFRSSYLPELDAVDVRQGSKGVATTVFAPAVIKLLTEKRVQSALRESATNEIESGPLHRSSKN